MRGDRVPGFLDLVVKLDGVVVQVDGSWGRHGQRFRSRHVATVAFHRFF